MKTCTKLFFVFLIISLTTVYGQDNTGIVIKGRVIDENTTEPVVSATVFLEGTTIGTTSNAMGEFELKNIPFGLYSLVVSSIGYEIKTIEVRAYHPQEFLFDVQMQQKVIILKDVNVVSERDEEWEDNIKIFKREFLGQSFNSKRSRIINPEVVNFRKDEQTKLLLAFTDSTIIVENKALGYRLYLILLSFSFDRRSKMAKYLAHVRFEELVPQNEDEKEDWEERRQKSYAGSEKHFFSALVNKKLHEEGFRISGYYPEDLSVEYEEDLDIIKFSIPKPLKISYSWDKYWSELKPVGNFILLDRFGNYVGGIQAEISGYWSSLRISDTLPFDYVLKKK